MAHTSLNIYKHMAHTSLNIYKHIAHYTKYHVVIMLSSPVIMLSPLQLFLSLFCNQLIAFVIAFVIM